MARHARGGDDRSRGVRRIVLGIVWLAGLTAGLFALLAASAKYGCTPGRSGLGCRSAGSLLGLGLVVVVIAVITTVTVVTDGAEPRRTVVVGGVAIVVLLACFLVAQSILATV